jgi:hypothetical protein
VNRTFCGVEPLVGQTRGVSHPGLGMRHPGAAALLVCWPCTPLTLASQATDRDAILIIRRGMSPASVRRPVSPLP